MGDTWYDQEEIGRRSRMHGTTATWEDAPKTPDATPGPAAAPKDEPPQSPKAQLGSAAPAAPRYGAPRKPDFATFTPESHAAPGADEGEAKLAANRDLSGKRLEDATKALEASKTMSPGEKIAMALVGLLPALGGGLVGAAIHNPTSIVAGISGGLEGGAKGTEMLNKDVKDRIGLAQKKVEDETGNVRGAEKDLLGRQIHNADYGRGLKDQDVAERNSAGLKSTEDRNNQHLHMYLGDQSRATALQVEQMRLSGELAKANKEKGNENDKVETAFGESYDQGMKALATLRQRVKEGGNWSSWLGGDEAHKSDMEKLPTDIATAIVRARTPMSRTVSPTEVARVAAGIKTGLFTPTSRTNAGLDTMEAELRNAAHAHINGAPHHSPLLDEPSASPVDRPPIGSGVPKDKYGF